MPAFGLVGFAFPFVADTLAFRDDTGADNHRVLAECLIHTFDDEMIDAAHVVIENQRRHAGSHNAVGAVLTLIDSATGSNPDVCHCYGCVVAV